MQMNEYLLKIKHLADMLGYAGHIVSVEDHIIHILSGLSIEYNVIVMIVNVKRENYTVSKVSFLLLQIEKI